MQYVNASETNERHIGYWSRIYTCIRDRNGWGCSKSAKHLSYWRRLLFIICALSNRKLLARFWDFIEENSLRLSIINANPSILEQTSRQWLYYQSTMQERVVLLEEHLLFLQSRLSEAALRNIYFNEGVILWKQLSQDGDISLTLNYDRLYRKEGLMAISLNIGEKRLYSTSFWISPDKNGEMALWIGCLQGARGESQAIHDLTKRFFGYRPKNLMVYAVRIVARLLQLERIYAVSNHGSYVNHRFYLNRRLKTSLDEFWGETGGQTSNDPRFFELPLVELRKSLEEVPSHKRNQYRKRFTVLDAIDAEMTSALEPYLIS